jgi:hypothetical protein
MNSSWIGLPTEATVAQVLVLQYADHLLLYRKAYDECALPPTSVAPNASHGNASLSHAICRS